MQAGTAAPPPWLQAALDPALAVLWLDTAALPASRDQRVHGSFQNACEAQACAEVGAALLARGVPPADLGITSPYSQQVRHVQGYVPDACVMTVDKFQGQDKGVMIVSLVRSNDTAATGALLTDFRRVNVALTRARTKLVIVGDSGTVCRVPTLRAVHEGVRELGRVIDLADAGFDFSEDVQ